MASVTGPLMSMDASGSLGGAIVFSKWKGRNYVRQYVIPANPQTALQMANRARTAFLSQAWAGLTAPEKASWDADAAAGQYSAFNAYTRGNSLLIGAGLAPSANKAHLMSDTSPTLGAQSATGHAGYATLSQAVVALQGGWGFFLFRSLTTGFTPSAANIAAILPFSGAATVTHDDTGLSPATYYYLIRAFTFEGKLSAAGAEMNAIVT